MASTTEAPRMLDVDSRDLPGIRTLTELPNGDLLAGTLASEVRLISQGELKGEWLLISDQRKASALERVRAISLLPGATGFYAAAGIAVWRVQFDQPDPEWSIRVRESFGFLLNSPHTAITLPDDRLWTSTDSGELQLRSSTGAILRRRSDNHSAHFAALLKDGRIAGADGTTLCVWDAETLKRHQYFPQTGTIFSFAASPTQPMVAIKVDGRILVWDLASEEIAHSFPVEPGLGLLAWRGEDDLLAIGVDDKLHLCSLTGEVQHIFAARAGARILSAAFAANREHIYVGCDDGSIQRFSL
jgi:WD40 repeat protein